VHLNHDCLVLGYCKINVASRAGQRAMGTEQCHKC